MEDHNLMQISPHVVIFPLPIQSPLSSMLKLADLILSLSQPTNISVTFITTDYIQRRLQLHSSAATRLAQNEPGFRFATLASGLGPDESPSGGVQLAKVTNWLEGQAQTNGSKLREVLASGSVEPEFKKPVSCIVADGYFGFMTDVAQELRVSLVYFHTISPSCLWTYHCVPKMLQAGDLPFQGNDLDAIVTSVPGMESYLRRRDLPIFCRNYDPENPIIQLVLNEAKNLSKAQGHILNTFDELETKANYFSHFQALCPNLYNIGPLHLNLKSRITKQEITGLSSNSLWQEDKSCLAWLDAQLSKSVLFVSMGSLAVMTEEQLMEIWYGLVNSKTKFLWVRRPGSIVESNNEKLEVPVEILEGTKETGYIVTWAPQDEVLAHRAIGGFFTHSGWYSTLESIVEGVPMICWPFSVDQQTISRLVSEVWKIGVDMKDICDRVVVEKMIKDFMGNKREEFLGRSNELAKLAFQAVEEGGSSYNSLNRLIDDIKFMRFSLTNK